MPGKTAKRSRTGGRGWGSGNEMKSKESWKKGRWETVEHSICRRARYVGRNGWGEGGEVSEDHEWQEREGKVRLIGGGDVYHDGPIPTPVTSATMPAPGMVPICPSGLWAKTFGCPWSVFSSYRVTSLWTAHESVLELMRQ